MYVILLFIISLVSCVKLLPGFRSSDRSDLHSTSPGDDRTGRSLAVPKHTSAHVPSSTRRWTERVLAPTGPSDARLSPPPHRVPLFLPFSVSDSPGTVKSSELSGGMSDDCVGQSAEHTNPHTVPHTCSRDLFSHPVLFYFHEADIRQVTRCTSHCLLNCYHLFCLLNHLLRFCQVSNPCSLFTM